MTLFTPQRLITTVGGRKHGQPGYAGGMQYGWSEPLGTRRKLFVASVVGAGILTFFIPLVRIDVPVVGKTQWSAFDVVNQMHQGRLPEPAWCETCREPAIRSLVALPFDVSLNYLVLALAFVALCFPESPGLLGGLAFVALMVSGWAQNSRTTARGFAHTFYGQDVSYHESVGYVHCGWLSFVLLGSMGALFYISIASALDRPSENYQSPHSEL